MASVRPIMPVFSGNPSAASGSIEFYEAGTTTAKNYYDKDGVAQGTSASLNAYGRVTGGAYGIGNYKFILKNSSGVILDTFDNVNIGSGIADGWVYDIAEEHGSYDSTAIAAAIAAKTGESVTFLLKTNSAGNWSITGNVTFESGHRVILPDGAILSIAASKSVTFTNTDTSDWSLSQHFTGSGTVVFASAATVAPEWWGAVTGGVSDCTAATRAAVTSLSSVGGTVLFHGGIYLIDADPGIEIQYSNISLRGAGIDVTYLQAGASTAEVIFIDGATVGRVSNSTISHLTIDGTSNYYATYGVRGIKCTNIEFEWVRIYRSGGYGGFFQGQRSGDGNNCTRVHWGANTVIQDCINNWGLEFKDANTASVFKGRIQSCDGGMHWNGADSVGAPAGLLATDGAVFESNDEGSNKTGILLDGCDACRVTGCYFEANVDANIRVQSSGATRDTGTVLAFNFFDSAGTTVTIDLVKCRDTLVINGDEILRMDVAGDVSRGLVIAPSVSAFNNSSPSFYNALNIGELSGAGSVGFLRSIGPDDTYNHRYSGIQATRITTDQTITTGVVTTVIFNDDYSGDNYDHNSEYDAATGIFTPTVPGVYLVMANLFVGGAGFAANTPVYIRLTKNGVLYYPQRMIRLESANNHAIAFTWTINIKQSDLPSSADIAVATAQYTGADMTVFKDYSSVSITKIR